MGESAYLHGVEPAEQGRLERLNDLLNGGSLRELRVVRGERVVDFGAGLAQLTRAMARAAAPGGRVIGIERSGEQIARARELARTEGEEELVELRRGDVLAPPLGAEEWGSFDLAHARFVLEHVADPLAVVRQMVRAVRIGGRIVLADDDHDVLRLWPEPPGFGALWEAYIRVIHLNRNDPFVGRRLVTLLHLAGARPRRSGAIHFGGCAGSIELATMVDNVIGLFEGVREALLEGSLLARLDYESALSAFRTWGKRCDAALWYAVPCAEGVRVR